MGIKLFDIEPEIDFYNGVHIDLAEEKSGELKTLEPSQIHKHITEFVEKAKKAEKYTSLWVRIPNEYSEFISFFLKNGFDYHHAKPGYAMLYQWIEASQIDRVPKYAHHVVGVGGLVYNSKSKSVLLVRERYSRFKSDWKFPGGASDPGETFAETGIREVFEETGVRSKFESVLTFRHQIVWSFGCSDLFVLCLLTPENEEDCVPNKCEHEIAECEWTPVEQAIKRLSGMNLLGLKQFLDKKVITRIDNTYIA